VLSNTNGKKNAKNGMSAAAKFSGAKNYKKSMTGHKYFYTESKNQAAFDGSYIKPWSQISQDPVYSGSVDQSEYPQTPLDSLDYSKRLRFE
jgi:hypothetical protein